MTFSIIHNGTTSQYTIDATQYAPPTDDVERVVDRDFYFWGAWGLFKIHGRFGNWTYWNQNFSDDYTSDSWLATYHAAVLLAPETTTTSVSVTYHMVTTGARSEDITRSRTAFASLDEYDNAPWYLINSSNYFWTWHESDADYLQNRTTGARCHTVGTMTATVTISHTPTNKPLVYNSTLLLNSASPVIDA